MWPRTPEPWARSEKNGSLIFHVDVYSQLCTFQPCQPQQTLRKRAFVLVSGCQSDLWIQLHGLGIGVRYLLRVTMGISVTDSALGCCIGT